MLVVLLFSPIDQGDERRRKSPPTGGARAPAVRDPGAQPAQPGDSGLVVRQVAAERPARPPGAERVLLDGRPQQKAANAQQNERPKDEATICRRGRKLLKAGSCRPQHAEKHSQDVRHEDPRRHISPEADGERLTKLYLRGAFGERDRSRCVRAASAARRAPRRCREPETACRLPSW